MFISEATHTIHVCVVEVYGLQFVQGCHEIVTFLQDPLFFVLVRHQLHIQCVRNYGFV
jgi:hypothetical protein